MGGADFWLDQATARTTQKRRKRVEGDLELLTGVTGQEDDTRVLVEWLQSGEDVCGELKESLDALESLIEGAELKRCSAGARQGNAI